MESYSSSSSSSSSSVSCPFVVYHEEEGKRAKALLVPSYHSSLHGVRRVPRPMTKKPIAPMPPTPPKIYKVEPTRFKETVQMLTTAQGFHSRRLQDVAPPPLDLLKPKSPESVVSNDATAVAAMSGGDDTHRVSSDISGEETTKEIMLMQQQPCTGSSNVCGGGYSSPLGIPPLSPSSLAWWASILPSPGTLSSL